MENNRIDINLSTDIKTDNLVPLNITLMSRDINNNSFLLKFKSNGSDVQLNNSFTVEILSVLPNSKIEILTQATVYGNTAMWEFDTKYITRNEVVSNYVYVKKDGVPIISADANAFTFKVGLSKIDESAGKTAETYDRNYEKVLHEFEVAINLTKDEWAQMADETREFVDQIKDVTVDQFVETKMGEELQNLEANYATRLTGLESNDATLTAQLAQTTDDLTGRAVVLETNDANLTAQLAQNTTYNRDVELINIIENGNFDYNTSGWQALYSNLNINGKSLIVTSDNTTIQPQVLYFSNHAVNPGAKTYVRLKASVSNSISQKIAVIIDGSTSGTNTLIVEKNIPIKDEEYSLSGITEQKDDFSGKFKLIIFHQYASIEAGIDKQLKISDVIAIDLTAAFGKGNEPTKEEMDSKLLSIDYFNATQFSYPTLVKNGLHQADLNIWSNNKKTEGTISILDFKNLVTNPNKENEDWATAFFAAAEYLKASQSTKRLVFPSGLYKYSESPNWAIPDAVIESDGEVRFRYTGVGNAVVLDAGEVTGYVFNLKFGDFIIECPPTAKNAIFIRGVHHSKIRAKVVGAGLEYAGLRVEWCVCTDFYVTVTSAGEGDWYLGGQPKYGIYIDKRELQAEGHGGYTSWCAFYTPIIELCKIGIHIERGQGNSFYSGTSEGHDQIGINLSPLAIYNKFYGIDLEFNTNFDIYCAGNENDFYSIDATGTILFDANAKNNVMTGGSLNEIALSWPTQGNIIQSVKYNRFNRGAIMDDQSGKNTLLSNRNVGLDRTENRPPSTEAIVVGESPFTYVNRGGNDEMIHIFGGSISTFMYVRAGHGDTSDVTPSYIRICPGDSIKINYTTKPTMRKFTT